MTIEVNKSDLINMVKGVSPSYKAMEHPLVQCSGRYVGGFSDQWVWNYNLKDMNEHDLLTLYNICKGVDTPEATVQRKIDSDFTEIKITDDYIFGRLKTK